MAATSRTHDERVVLFLKHQVIDRRDLIVSVNAADERRLVAFIERFNADTPDDPMNPGHDDDLAVALMGAADRGMHDDEDDCGIWTHLDGRAFPLPRPVRAPVLMRARIALRAAHGAWRSS